MWEILHEEVYKTRITDLELSTTPLMNGCRNDDIQSSHPVLSRCFNLFGSVMHILYSCNQLDSNLTNMGATIEVE